MTCPLKVWVIIYHLNTFQNSSLGFLCQGELLEIYQSNIFMIGRIESLMDIVSAKDSWTPPQHPLSDGLKADLTNSMCGVQSEACNGWICQISKQKRLRSCIWICTWWGLLNVFEKRKSRIKYSNFKNFSCGTIEDKMEGEIRSKSRFKRMLCLGSGWDDDSLK